MTPPNTSYPSTGVSNHRDFRAAAASADQKYNAERRREAEQLERAALRQVSTEKTNRRLVEEMDKFNRSRRKPGLLTRAVRSLLSRQRGNREEGDGGAREPDGTGGKTETKDASAEQG